MKALARLLLALLFVASTVRAGEIYGTIVDGNKPVAAGVKVDISVGGKVCSTETDKFGSYRTFVKEKGKGTLTVHVGEDPPSIGLVSFDKSTRYDWILETKDGKRTLRRK